MESVCSRQNLDLIRGFIEVDTKNLPDKLSKEVCERILISWVRFERLADSTFVGEFTNGSQDTLVQRFWELYVGNRLQNRFKKVSSNDSGPDFKVEHKK